MEIRALLYTSMFARAFGIFCCLLQFVWHTWQFALYISFRLQQLNRKMAYCCIPCCSLVLSASSPASAWFGTTVFSYSKIKPERQRALLYTLIFARAFGIFCCLLQFVWHNSQFVLYISFRLQQLNRKMAYCSIPCCSLVLSASYPASAWFGTTYLAVRRIHITSCQIDHEHHVVDFLVSYTCFVFKN